MCALVVPAHAAAAAAGTTVGKGGETLSCVVQLLGVGMSRKERVTAADDGVKDVVSLC